MKRTIGVVCLAVVLASGGPARAQQPPAAGDEGGTPRADRQAAPEPKPYDKVITKDAKSDPGVFTVHRVKEKVYYEIPATEFGKDFLWVTQVAKTTLGAGYGGQSAGQRVVRWERRDNRVLLRSVSYDVVADKAEADREGRRRGQLQPDRHGLQRRSRQQGPGRRRRHRRDAPVHDRGARVVDPVAAARARLRRQPRVRRARERVSRQHQRRGHSHLHRSARDGAAVRGRRPRRRCRACRRRRSGRAVTRC